MNHKAVSRLWQKLGLQAHAAAPAEENPHRGERSAEWPSITNHVWTYDFVFAWTMGGDSLKFLTLEDEYTRESLAIEVGRTFKALHVREVLTTGHSASEAYRSSSAATTARNSSPWTIGLWLKDLGIGTHLIDPGKPWQNGFAESFNARFRDECLNRRDLPRRRLRPASSAKPSAEPLQRAPPALQPGLSYAQRIRATLRLGGSAPGPPGFIALGHPRCHTNKGWTNPAPTVRWP